MNIQGADEGGSTFSEGREELFKRANELCAVGEGVETAVILYSPSGESFTFGQPSVEAVVKKFMELPPEERDGDRADAGAESSDLCRRYREAAEQLRATRERNEKMRAELISYLDERLEQVNERLTEIHAQEASKASTAEGEEKVEGEEKAVMKD